MYKQYNLKDINGLHLKSPYDYNSYSAKGLDSLIENFDFYPLKSSDLNRFIFINGSYRSVPETSKYHNKIMGNAFIGDNSYTNRTHNLSHTQIRKTNELVKGEKYYTKFDFYFNFDGDAYGFEVGDSGYNIVTSLYAVLGNNKRKLKLSNLCVYDFNNPLYQNTTENPLEEGYVPIGLGNIYSNNVSISGDDIDVSYIPESKEYQIGYKGIGFPSPPVTSSVTYIEANEYSVNFGSSISITLSSDQFYAIKSFNTPTFNTPSNGFVIDLFENQLGGSPFSVMRGGYLFRVTAELDTSSLSEFDANICKGGKDMKIIVDYNGTFSQTIITYEQSAYQASSSVSLAQVGPAAVVPVALPGAPSGVAGPAVVVQSPSL